jgi:DNA transposition AAA+ family ATPase
MKKGFVHTENYKRLVQAQQEVERRGAQEAGLVIIKGQYGVGKSEIVERWAVDNGAVFVRAKETWTKRALIDELAERLDVDTRGRNSEVQARVIGRLAIHARPMVFDEADFLVRGAGSKSSPALLECVRDITDVTGVACFLVGMEEFASKVARHGHIASRVNRIVEFQPLTLADVTSTCAKLADVKIRPDVVEAIHLQSAGKMRLALNAISNIEQLAAANGLAEVGAEHIKGKPLCVEFKAGQRRGAL